MYAKLRRMIVAEAKADAALFVEEFNEALNPAATDWDAEAWALGDAHHAADASESSGDGWELYQSTLIAETLRLVTEAEVSP